MGNKVMDLTEYHPPFRNAVAMEILPRATFFSGFVIEYIVIDVLLRAKGTGPFVPLGMLAGIALWYAELVQMCNQLQAVTKNWQFAWWPILVPLYNVFWLVGPLRREMTMAKQLRGVQEATRGRLAYLFFSHYALAADLNDIARYGSTDSR